MSLSSVESKENLIHKPKTPRITSDLKKAYEPLQGTGIDFKSSRIKLILILSLIKFSRIAKSQIFGTVTGYVKYL